MINFLKRLFSKRETSGLEWPDEISLRKQIVDRLASKNDWNTLAYNDGNFMISYTKESKTNGKMRINVYLTTLTVGTALNHPKQKKTQMFRKNVSIELMGEIFKNPRVHSNKGYQKKRK